MDKLKAGAASSRPKVLAVSYLFPNSAHPNHGVFVLNRLKALSRYVDITVINPVPWFPLNSLVSRYKHFSQLPEVENIGGLTVHHPRYFSVPGMLKGIEGTSYKQSVEKTVKKLESDFPFDLIDLHWTYPDLPAGVFLKERYEKPLLCTLRGMEAFHRGQGKMRSDQIDQGLKSADRLIALSAELKETADTITAQSDKSQVITNGVDTQVFYYKNKDEARRELSLPTSDKLTILLGVGSLIHRKGFDLVLDALPNLVKSNPNLKYYILGSQGPEGDYRAELQNKVKQHQLEDVVVFYGAVPNNTLVTWYNASDAFCLSSRGEGSPNVLSEALACGCPSVSSAVGAAPDIMAMAGLPELVIDDTTDSQQLARCITNALDLQEEREQKAGEYSQYNWDWCANRVLKVYGEVLGRC